jgi:hypothetical protein
MENTVKVKVKVNKPVSFGKEWYQIGEQIEIPTKLFQEGVLHGVFSLIPEFDNIVIQNEKKEKNLEVSTEEFTEDSVIENLCQIDNITQEIAKKLYDSKYFNPELIVAAGVEGLKKLKISEKAAINIIKSARTWVEE